MYRFKIRDYSPFISVTTLLILNYHYSFADDARDDNVDILNAPNHAKISSHSILIEFTIFCISMNRCQYSMILTYSCSLCDAEHEYITTSI